MGDVDADGARRRPLADDDVEEEVLHRGIEDLLDLVVEAMYLVHEEDVARLEVGEDGGEVPSALDGGARGGVHLGPHLVCHDARERRLAEARGAREDHVVERLAAVARGLDEHAEVLPHALLADVLVERPRPERAVLVEVVGGELARDVTRARGAGGRGAGEEVLLARLPHHRPLPRRLRA